MKFDMDVTGPEWQGWQFAPYGRARSWRLIDPHGTWYTAAEISELPNLYLDIDYLRLRITQLEQQRQTLSIDEATILRAAAEILSRVASPYKQRTRTAGANVLTADRFAPEPREKAHGNPSRIAVNGY